MTQARSTPDARPADAPRRPALSPLRSPRAWLVLLLTSLLGLAADLASKDIAFRRIAAEPVEISREQVLRVANPSHLLPAHEPIHAVPGWLDFTLVLNPGAVFGIGAGKRWVFVVFTFLAMGFALTLFARWTVARDWWSHAALGLLVAGGVGNLYDRLVYACVRDFIHPLPDATIPRGWPWGGRELWPYVSNVADLLLIIGIAMLLWRSLRPHPDQPRTPA